ncbi:hypothetical protein IKE67_03095 [bacterium]|nr:hypothetical protein [bacterium]
MPEILDFTEVLEFKKAIDEKYGLYVHFHDACGGQYFSFDETKDGVQQYAKEYFSVKNLLPVFAEDGLSFTLERIEIC